jgi:hypothetical protein
MHNLEMRKKAAEENDLLLDDNSTEILDLTLYTSILKEYTKHKEQFKFKNDQEKKTVLERAGKIAVDKLATTKGYKPIKQQEGAFEQVNFYLLEEAAMLLESLREALRRQRAGGLQQTLSFGQK